MITVFITVGWELLVFCRRHISVNTLLSPSSSVSSSTTLSRHQIVKVDNFLKLSLFPWICCSVSCVRFFATPWTVAYQAVHGDSSGKNTGVGCHALLQGIFPTQGSNPGLVHCRWILYCLNHHRHSSVRVIYCVNPFKTHV